MTHAGGRLVLMMTIAKVPCLAATHSQLQLPGGLLLIHIVQQMILHHLILESIKMLCHLELFHPRSLSPNTVTVYGGGYRI